MAAPLLLALDPSSVCVGYALMRGRDLVEAGRILPAKQKMPARERVRGMTRDALVYLEEARPEIVVVEVSSGHVGRSRHGGAGAGLATYGYAVGYLVAAVEASGRSVQEVEENTWTRGRSKADRTAEIGLLYRGYKPAADPGGDAADAIGLGRWWAGNALNPVPTR